MGFTLTAPEASWLQAAAAAVAEAADLPAWMMLAGPHGEFELIVTVAPSRERAFLAAAANVGWRPIPLGRSPPRPGSACRAARTS